MVGTLEQALEMRNGTPDLSSPQEITDYDGKIIGESCRLEIPFRDVYRMRQVADLLRGYANLLELYSKRTDLPARTILSHLRTEARMLNHKIRMSRGPGRPRKEKDGDGFR